MLRQVGLLLLLAVGVIPFILPQSGDIGRISIRAPKPRTVPNVAGKIHKAAKRYGLKVPTSNADTFNEPLLDDSDSMYFGIGQIGTPSQYFYLLFDTGSSNLWVQDVNCKLTNIACKLHTQYDCKASSTCNHTAEFFQIQYGSGSLNGTVYHDIYCFGSDHNTPNFCTDKNQGFAGAISEPGATFLTVDFDGILGMAYDSISVNNIPQPMDQIFAKPMCSQKLFAFWLNRDLKHNVLGGEMTLCGMDPTHYNGPITWVPVKAKDYWRISMNSVSVTGTQITGMVDAIVDTGTTLLMGPSADIAKINMLIEAQDIGGGEYEVNCNNIPNLPAVTITIAGKNFVLQPQDYVLQFSNQGQKICISGFAGFDMDPGQPPMWILGDVFIGKWYSVFDFANSRVGFANATWV